MNTFQLSAEAIAELNAMEADAIKSMQKQTPSVGDSIEIKHEVKRGGDGSVYGLQRNSRSTNTEVTRVYLDGTVATGRGDVWEVKLSGGRCKWETVNPIVNKDQEF